MNAIIITVVVTVALAAFGLLATVAYLGNMFERGRPPKQ